MESLDLKTIEKILARNRLRPNYTVSMLEFKLGREPTQDEIDQVNYDFELNQAARKLWEKMQPWPNRYKFNKRERLENILLKRYGVPQSIIDALIEEVDPGDDW